MIIAEAGRALRERKISVAELTKEALAAAARANSGLNAFITITEETALKRAAELDEDLTRGIDHGPLHGIPVAHKDAFYTKGVRTTAGTKILSDFVPEEDADLVERLRKAGTIMIGKTNLHELCHGITSNNPQYAAGMRMEPPVSVPVARGTIPAANAAPDPPLDPPGIRVTSQGFLTAP